MRDLTEKKVERMLVFEGDGVRQSNLVMRRLDWSPLLENGLLSEWSSVKPANSTVNKKLSEWPVEPLVD